jgi:hypothetical protein
MLGQRKHLILRPRSSERLLNRASIAQPLGRTVPEVGLTIQESFPALKKIEVLSSMHSLLWRSMRGPQKRQMSAQTRLAAE